MAMKTARSKKVTLSAKLYAAMEKYFQVKAAGKGMFPDKETKQNLCGDIVAAAPQFTVTIFPGVIELDDSKGRAAIITESTLHKKMLFKANWNLREAFNQQKLA